MKKQPQIVSKDYIFTENKNGELIFRGNFEDYYKDVNDPWGQSALGEDDMDSYYRLSRMRVKQRVKDAQAKTVLEIGCGLGFALNQIAEGISSQFHGTDISPTAIAKAKELFPAYEFYSADISTPELNLPYKNYDLIILNQLLWYILPNLDSVVTNINNHLNVGGHLIVSNAFAREQRYGKEIIDGFAGATHFFEKCSASFQLREACFNDNDYRVTDGLFMLRKII